MCQKIPPEQTIQWCEVIKIIAPIISSGFVAWFSAKWGFDRACSKDRLNSILAFKSMMLSYIYDAKHVVATQHQGFAEGCFRVESFQTIREKVFTILPLLDSTQRTKAQTALDEYREERFKQPTQFEIGLNEALNKEREKHGMEKHEYITETAKQALIRMLQHIHDIVE
jgi:hypothetical protein